MSDLTNLFICLGTISYASIAIFNKHKITSFTVGTIFFLATLLPYQNNTNESKLTVGENSVVMGNVPPNTKVGSGSVVIGPTDNRGNTIINTPMAVGKNAQAGQNSIAIGANAGAGLNNNK